MIIVTTMIASLFLFIILKSAAQVYYYAESEDIFGGAIIGILFSVFAFWTFHLHMTGR